MTDFDETKRPQVGVAIVALDESSHNHDEDDLRYIIGRKKSGNRAGQYAFPGGHVEFGETLQETAAREFLEETGIDMHPAAFSMGELVQEVNAQGKHYMTFFMSVDVPADKMKNLSNPESHKQEDWELMTIEEIVKLSNLDHATHFVLTNYDKFESVDVFTELRWDNR